MKTVLIATKNQGKAKEFESLFAPRGYQVQTLLDIPDAPDVAETGTTFVENAVIKAEAIARMSGKVVLADDSGLSVDALDGRPGVYSARYAGEDKDDEKNMQKLLGELKDVPEAERTARFHCVLAIASPNQETITAEGTVEGRITLEKKGTNGFGYDPLFFVPEKGRTMAELKSSEKNAISHRARAMEKIADLLDEFLAKEPNNQ